jgi:hypothetical protein
MASARDVVTGMFARRQIDDAMFQAAASISGFADEAAWAASVKSVAVVQG